MEKQFQHLLSSNDVINEKRNLMKLVSNQLKMEVLGRIPSYKPLEVLASHDVALDATITLAGIRSIADQPIRIHAHRTPSVDDPRPRFIYARTTAISPTYGFLFAICKAGNGRLFNALNEAFPWVDLEVYAYQDVGAGKALNIAIVPLDEELDQDEWLVAQQLLNEALAEADIEVVESLNPEFAIPTSSFPTNSYERNRNNRMGFRLKLVKSKQKK